MSLKATPGGIHVLTTAQTANGASDDVLFRKFVGHGPVGLVVVSTVGGSPTVKLNIQGSSDGTNWHNIPYALVATPSTFVVAEITITTATTVTYLLQTDQPWMYLRTSTNNVNNVTLTITAYP